MTISTPAAIARTAMHSVGVDLPDQLVTSMNCVRWFPPESIPTPTRIGEFQQASVRALPIGPRVQRFAAGAALPCTARQARASARPAQPRLPARPIRQRRKPPWEFERDGEKLPDRAFGAAPRAHRRCRVWCLLLCARSSTSSRGTVRDGRHPDRQAGRCASVVPADAPLLGSHAAPFVADGAGVQAGWLRGIEPLKEMTQSQFGAAGLSA